MIEEWKEVPIFTNYSISNYGEIISKTGRILKPNKSKKGYLYLKLSQKGLRRRKFKIHQLVAMAFLNHVPNGMNLVVDHIDENKLNNRSDNLRIVTNRFNLSRNSTSKYIGISKYVGKTKDSWYSSINNNGKREHIGTFKCEFAAAVAYKMRVVEIDSPHLKK